MRIAPAPSETPTTGEIQVKEQKQDPKKEEEEPQNAIEALIESNLGSYSLDCYPYSFSPLLLFTSTRRTT